MPIGTTSNMEWISGPGGSGSVEYTAGHGIDIDNEEHIISVDTGEVQEKLTAGQGITIQNNVISANPQRQADWNQSDSSAADYIRNKPDLSNYATQSDLAEVQGDVSDIASDLSGKADKVTGATAGNLAALNASGNLTDSGQSSANLVHDASYVHTDNNFTTVLKTKLEGVQSGAEQNVQADWAQSDTSSDSYIQHKPDLSVYATQTDLASKQDTLTAGSNITITNNVISATAAQQVQSNWAETDPTDVSYIQNKPVIPSSMKLLAAGNCLALTDGQVNVTMDWVTTAGITDIQQVSALPANPVSTVLYIIPEP